MKEIKIEFIVRIDCIKEIVNNDTLKSINRNFNRFVEDLMQYGELFDCDYTVNGETYDKDGDYDDL